MAEVAEVCIKFVMAIVRNVVFSNTGSIEFAMKSKKNTVPKLKSTLSIP